MRNNVNKFILLPSIKRYFTMNLVQILICLLFFYCVGMPRTPPPVACQYCGAVFRAGNHTTRLEPRLKLNKKLRKLVTRQQNGEKLGRFQQKVITMYIASNNRVVSFTYNIKQKTIVKAS